MRLFVGDDWAEDHHDVELMDAAGRVLARKRLPEGVTGMAGLHALVGEQLGDSADGAEVAVGTGTDRGPWVAALVAAGYQVFAVNPVQVARYRERHSISGAKSDAADAHTLLRIATSLRKSGNEAEGLSLMEHGTQAHPGDAAMFVALADYYTQMGDPAKASAALQKSKNLAVVN